MTTDGTGPKAGRVALSQITGPCGDSVGIGLVFRGQRIEEVAVETDGCESTQRCAAAVARLTQGMTIAEAMAVSAADVMRDASGTGAVVPHCALLATSALYRVLGQALLSGHGSEAGSQ